MTALASLALQNNAAAAVTFTPVGRDSQGVTKWMTQDSVYDARKVVTMSLTHPKNGSSVIRLKFKVSIPVMDAVDAAKKMSDCYANVELVMPKTASETTRLDLRKLLDTLLISAVTTAAVQLLEDVY